MLIQLGHKEYYLSSRITASINYPSISFTIANSQPIFGMTEDGDQTEDQLSCNISMNLFTSAGKCVITGASI
jgi:hypothetical protein